MWIPLLVAMAVTPEVSALRTSSPTASGTTVYESGEFLRVVVPLGIMFFVIGGLVGFKEYKRRKKTDGETKKVKSVTQVKNIPKVERSKRTNDFFD